MSLFTENNSHLPEMQQNLKLLQEQPFFSTFPTQAIKLLAYLAERIRFAKDEIIVEEGDDFGRAFLVLSGQLALSRMNGDKETIIRHYEEGALLGSFSLVGEMPSLFQLRATTTTEALTITRKHFTKIVDQFPLVSALALKALLKELHQWERKNLNKAGTCCFHRTGATVL